MELYKPDTCLKIVMKLSEKYPDIFAELSEEIKSTSGESYTTDESSDESSADESSVDESSAESSADESSSESSADESKYEYKVICSPIPNKKKSDKLRSQGKPCARTDFEEQKERNEFILNGDLFWCWDDAPENKAKVGDIFIFWDYDGKGKGEKGQWRSGNFHFHKVNSVCEPSNRLPSWSANVGQSHRNVLELSAPKFTLSYDEMINYGAKPQYHGTKYPKAGFERGSPLINIIDEKFE
jgi:hypothetical protein